jgi:N utilization substance protein B
MAREIALQILFQVEVNKDADQIEAALACWAEEFSLPKTYVPFAREIIEGTLENQEEIDQKISALADGWPLGRMPNVDRNLLRLAAYEIFYCPNIPGAVTLNEAIELAKRFSGADSAKFINGILDKFMASAGKRETLSRDGGEEKAKTGRSGPLGAES